jgi:hypothetical protein
MTQYKIFECKGASIVSQFLNIISSLSKHTLSPEAHQILTCVLVQMGCEVTELVRVFISKSAADGFDGNKHTVNTM